MSKQLVPFMIILAIAVGSAFILRETLDAALVAPLLYLFWLSRLLLLSLPQVFLWGLFLIVAAMISVRLLWQPRPPAERTSPRPVTPTGRVEAWLKLIGQAKEEPYYRWQLAQRLRHLILDALAHDLRLTRRQVRQRLTDNQLDLPPDIQAYLQASRSSFGHFTPQKRRFFNLKRTTPPSPLDLPPEKIAQFIEERFQL